LNWATSARLPRVSLGAMVPVQPGMAPAFSVELSPLISADASFLNEKEARSGSVPGPSSDDEQAASEAKAARANMIKGLRRVVIFMFICLQSFYPRAI